ncbi:MAG: hypothetical protein R2867_03730 [Caldilineaceae bacterium]
MLHQDQGRAATWVGLLLGRAPRIQILITSRERLQLSSERTFELQGLSLPTADLPLEMAGAVLLFLERAQQVAPEFCLADSNKAAVVQICRLLDGMPLGIELAAAWVHILPPAEIAEELARNIDFLTRTNRDAAPRHRSMRAIFDHSWALLDETEREVLGRLAVFRGGWERAAAAAVAGATLPLLAKLIDKSLVRRHQQTPHARYNLHEVVRQFAAEKRRQKIGAQHSSTGQQRLEVDDAWLAHYTYYYQWAVTATGHLQDREQLHWLQLLDEEHANLRAALDRCLATQDLARGLQLAICLSDYWYIRGHHREGYQWLLAFLQPDVDDHANSDTFNGLAAAAILAIAGGDYGAAHAHLERSMAKIQQCEDQATLARVLRYRGLVALHEEDFTTAEALVSEAVAIATAINNHSEAATSLIHLAEIALIRAEYVNAQVLGEQAVQILRMIEDKNQLAGALRRLAQTRSHQGEWRAAYRDAMESLALNNEVRDQRGTAASLVLVAHLLFSAQKWPATVQLLGAVDALLKQAQASLLPADQAIYDAIRQQIASHHSDFATFYEAGQLQITQQQTMPFNLAWVSHLLDVQS